jgi:integrase
VCILAHPQQASGPAAWVVRTALNMNISRWRRRRREVAVPDPGVVADLPASDGVADSSVDPRIMAALMRQPAQQRQVIALRLLLDLDTARAAEVLGIAPNTVRAHMTLALAALRDDLMPERQQGERAALRRRDVDVQFGTVRVERSLSELPGGGYLFGPPKSAAGRRVVVLPAAIKPALADHLAAFTLDHHDALVFTSPAGMPMRPTNFRRRVWYPALAEAGLPGIHFHDLGHTGNALTAATRATLRELMDRMGHSSTRAALIYLHGNDDRQRAIADGLSKLTQQELRRQKPRSSKQARGERSGTRRTRKARERMISVSPWTPDASAGLVFCEVGLPGLEPGTSSLSGFFLRARDLPGRRSRTVRMVRE